MRHFLRIFPLFAALALAASASEISFVRVLPQWRDAASFKRISEYFTGRENPSGATVLRTHPESRGGYYFLARLLNQGAPVSVKIELSLITPHDARPKNFSFSTELTSGKNLLNIGLTGDDWLDPQAHPVAWKLEIRDANGVALASQQSYLWDHPEN